MKKFRVKGVKNNKKVNLIISNETLGGAKDYLKKQGYAIIEIEELEKKDQQDGEEFFFEAMIEGIKKSGKIYSDDIFKAYVKLVDHLGYTVLALYKDKDIDDRQKKLMLFQLKKNYKTYKGQQLLEGKHKKEKQKKELYAKKKITELHAVAKDVETKLVSLIEEHKKEIEQTAIEKLQDSIPDLKKIVTSSNIDKIKSTLENVLVLIGEQEVEIAKTKSPKKRKQFLETTNKLLKAAGSSKQVYVLQDTLVGKTKILFNKVSKPPKKAAPKKVKREAKKINKNSFQYYQAKQNSQIYAKKLKELRKEKLRNMFSSDKRKEAEVKIKATKNALFILSKRITHNPFNKTIFTRRMSEAATSGIGYLRDLSWVITLGMLVYIGFFLLHLNGYWFFLGDRDFLLHEWSANVGVLLIAAAIVSRIIKNSAGFVFYGGVYILFLVFIRVNFF